MRLRAFNQDQGDGGEEEDGLRHTQLYRPGDLGGAGAQLRGRCVVPRRHHLHFVGGQAPIRGLIRGQHLLEYQEQ